MYTSIHSEFRSSNLVSDGWKKKSIRKEKKREGEKSLSQNKLGLLTFQGWEEAIGSRYLGKQCRPWRERAHPSLVVERVSRWSNFLFCPSDHNVSVCRFSHSCCPTSLWRQFVQLREKRQLKLLVSLFFCQLQVIFLPFVDNQRAWDGV